jgi:hypothetical protein
VHWSKTSKKWYARVGHENVDYTVGYFDDEVEAARAYDGKALELHGERARLNFDPVTGAEIHGMHMGGADRGAKRKPMKGEKWVRRRVRL